ncbi:MAG: hypothetical protein HQ521_20400, partial [Bacteroidetes bacterium]|nr:hypothetical protein [Bacteroidota bacterium]
MKSKTLIISILLIGCNLSQEQNLYIESPENYIPDVSFTEGVLLTQQIKEELDLFEYINSLYIDPLTYAYNHLEELYNGKLFKNEEMVLNIRKDFLFDDNTTGKI